MRLLDDGQLQEIRDTLAARIREGLETDGKEIKALDAHLGPPPEDLDGRALVVDIGGTNMRAALASIRGGRATIEHGPTDARLDFREEETSRAEFFAQQARLAKSISSERDLPVGYCFSYPSQVLPSLDARLLRWTKGIDIPGVVGCLVGEGLAAALADEGIPPACVHVLNDTVASMIGGALDYPGPSRHVIGLIAGTGSNMAAFFEAERFAKLRDHDGDVAINLESGNFDCPHLTEADDAVDRASNTPGEQRFEKAISGYYLPFLYRELSGDEAFDPMVGSAELVRRRDEDGDEVAEAIIERAEALIATGLAAVADARGNDDPVVVLAEGSLFWKTPGFAEGVRERLTKMVTQPCSIRRLEHANLIGSACAALAR